MSIAVDDSSAREADARRDDTLREPVRAVVPVVAEDAAAALARIERVLFGRGDVPMLGRYRLSRCIGTGGMGTVWAAEDPELHRDVAIKLVRADRLDSAYVTRARFVREMRALGRINHPNVVALFDCGTYEVDPTTMAERPGVYMVTELVLGQRLDVWLRGATSTAQVLDLCAAIGGGLAAAHDAGLVHRDFKPANVLVAPQGATGEYRPRVLDFGLARAADPAEAHATAPELADSSPSSGDTTDHVVGTPRWMAPEQAAGEPLDARADQYAFCLVVAEALVDAPLFAASGAGALDAAKRAGPPALAPRGFAASARVWSVLARGLAPDPTRRWPSMHALLHALARARRNRWRPWLLGGTALAAAVLGVGALARTAAPACPLPVDLSASWNRDVSQQLAATLPGGDHTAWAEAALGIDAFARAWQDARIESCRAPVLASAVECLARSRDELDALLAALAEGGAAAPRIGAAVAGLSAPASCIDAPSTSPLLAVDDPAMVARVQGAEQRAEALVQLGRYADAAAASEVIITAASGGTSGLQAYAHGRAASVLRQAEELDRARDGFEHSYYLALDADAHELAHKAAAELTRHYADALHDPERASLWLGHTEAALERMSAPSLQLRAKVYNLRATLAHARFDYAQEYREREQELDLLEQDPVSSSEMITLARAELGHSAIFLGRYAEAVALLGPAAEEIERREGPSSPRVLIVRLNLGDAMVKEGRIADGLRVLGIVANDAPLESIVSIFAAIGVTEARWMLDQDAEAALAGYRRVLGRMETQPHVNPREVALLHYRIGLVLAAAGRHADAEAEQWAAITGIEAIAGADAAVLGELLVALAAAQRAQGHADAADATDHRRERLRPPS